MSVLRPLPSRPSLEYEHKEAKALLRRLKSGDPDSLARAGAHLPKLDASGAFQLSDAQLIIAREYGFASWPRLVRYFEDVERQRHYLRQLHGRKPESYDRDVARLFRDAGKRHPWVAFALGAYVPRFYGLRADDIFRETLSDDDARLVVARMNGSSSWETLMERARQGDGRLEESKVWEVDPMRLAGEAIRAGDLDQLRRLVDVHPDLLHPPEADVSRGYSLVRAAISLERSLGRQAVKPILDWLETQGLDVQQTLNLWLCNARDAEQVRHLLERGADPNWVAPNGIPVLEHALLRYWDGALVDLVAAHATPRDALWIAAGLGDVDGVRRSLDRDGKPTESARRLRPNFDAVGPMTMPQHPDPTDEEILTEALFVAVLNQRINVIEYLASRGCSMDGLMMGMPSISTAIGRGSVDVIECLMRCGADVDLSGWQPGYSARELATEMLVQSPADETRRRIAELCAAKPETILAEFEKNRKPLGVHPTLQESLELAGDDAYLRGQAEITPENLLYGLLRGDRQARHVFVEFSGIDAPRFHADAESRLRIGDHRPERPKLPLIDAAQDVVKRAFATAAERRRDTVYGVHVLRALANEPDGVIAALLPRYGASVERFRERIESVI
jgi:hypothetical protein